MKKNWMILVGLVGAALVAAPFAAAQEMGEEFENDDGLGEAQVGALDVTTAGTCIGTGGLGLVSDFETSAQQEVELAQDVEVDEDDVLLAIALANNGATDITFDDVRSVAQTEQVLVSTEQQTDLEREDVFSALALGVDADAGDLETLACVAEMDRTVVAERTTVRETDLDEDNVLLAIALSNSIGTQLDYESVADIEVTSETELVADQGVDVDLDDTFLALALGAGGNGADFGGI